MLPSRSTTVVDRRLSAAWGYFRGWFPVWGSVDAYLNRDISRADTNMYGSGKLAGVKESRGNVEGWDRSLV